MQPSKLDHKLSCSSFLFRGIEDQVSAVAAEWPDRAFPLVSSWPRSGPIQHSHVFRGGCRLDVTYARSIATFPFSASCVFTCSCLWLLLLSFLFVYGVCSMSCTVDLYFLNSLHMIFAEYARCISELFVVLHDMLLTRCFFWFPFVPPFHLRSMPVELMYLIHVSLIKNK